MLIRQPSLTYGRTPRPRRKGLSVKAFLAILISTLFSLQIYLIAIHKSGISKSSNDSTSSTTTTAGATNISSRTSAEKSRAKHDELPKWITDYIAWHNEMRTLYPGKLLFEDPNAPHVIVRVCLGLCGGLNDRLGQLPWDLYVANQTRRVLFMKWDRPKPLEEFLVPNLFNWTVPADAMGFEGMKETRAQKEFFEGYRADRPEKEFWETELDISLERARSGEFKDIKILRHILLGHLNENVLEQRLRDLGETDMLHWTPSFGKIFHAFFKPSAPVQAELDAVYETLGLTPGKYSAVHCRVRHPKATPHGILVLGKDASHPADKTGLPWVGQTKDFAVSIATHAVMCARTLSSSPSEPIYFFADSNDLVRYMAHEITQPNYLASNKSLFENPVDQAALKAVAPTKILAREMSMENAHIDRQKGRPPPAYYATFVDLMLAVNARCVTYGIGFYAIFATKISGIQCKLVYQEEEWGGKEGGKGAALCTDDTYKHLL
jgi:hypothetical protein